MKRSLALLFLFAALRAPAIVVSGSTDRDPLSYEAGQDARFRFSVKEASPEADVAVKWSARGDAPFEQDSGVERLTPGCREFEIVKTLSAPGFVIVSAAVVDGATLRPVRVSGRPVASTVAAGFSVGSIANVQEPEDFDAFWSDVAAEAAGVDLAAATVAPAPDRIAARFPGSDVFSFSVPIAGRRPATGWVAIPRGAEGGVDDGENGSTALPVRISFRDYGIGGGEPAADIATRDAVGVDVNAHGFDLGRDVAYYREFMHSISDGGHGGGYGFRDAENESPETSPFRDMILRALVATRFVRSMSAGSGALELRGAGQGALLATAVAALSSGATELRVERPWPCDIGGAETFGRLPAWLPAYRPALRYFDAANFAKRVPADCDAACDAGEAVTPLAPPSSTAIFCNALNGRTATASGTESSR